MIAGLDEPTVLSLIAVLGGAGILALLAALVLWRRERVRGAETAAALDGAPGSQLAKADEAATLPDVVQGDAAGRATPASAPVPPRVELFPQRVVCADVDGLGAVASVGPAVTPVMVPENSEIVRAGSFSPPVDLMKVDGSMVNTPAGLAILEPAAQPVARRRPRPAWELAEDGQTPDGLLVRAHELLAAGLGEEAAVQLRACARLASRLNEPAIEAVARLEMGDLCQASGDMTTACEHWQMARSLYAEMKRGAEVAAAVKRMEKAGCPTDWVLTKF